MSRKKAPKSYKIQKVHEVDLVPKWWKQQRSAGGHRRRRSEFSPFFSSSSPSSALSNSPLSKVGLLLESSRGKDEPGCDTITDLEEMRTRRENILQFPAVQCSNFEDLRKTLFSNFTGVPVIEAESFSENALFGVWRGRNADKQKSDTVGKLDFTPDKSQINESSNFCITPGSVAWDKTTCQLWPIEALECQSFSKEFTESSDDPNCSITRDPSPDKWNSSSSSRTESECMDRRRGTRERKPKVHFDEVNFSSKSLRKDRRFRIMRFLGLAAPVASPFH